MKVILLTDQFIQNKDTFIVGGWIQSLINILEESEKIEIAVVGLTNSNSCVEKENDTTYYKVRKQIYSNPLRRIYNRWKCVIQNNREIKEYISAIQDFKPDIVHLFGTESFVCNVIPHVDAKAVVHLQGLINPYLNVWFPPGISPNLLNFHSFNLFDFLKGVGLRPQYKIFQAMARRETNYFRSIRFVMGRTDWDRAMATTLIEGVKYFHLEESLRSDFHTSQQWEVKSRKEFRFMSVLSPSTYKGFDLILKTAFLLKSKGVSFEWIVCGTSENETIIKVFEKILKKNFNQNNVSFLGKRTSKELVSFLLDTDLFIHPSYIENSPNSVCEAQILGVPVIAANVGGISSLIENDQTGILFPANDSYYLSEKITSLLANPQKMQQMGENAKNVAEKRHDRSNILKNIELIYNEIIQM